MDRVIDLKVKTIDVKDAWMGEIVAAQYEPVFDLGLQVGLGQLKASGAIEIVTKSTGLNETSEKYSLDVVLAMLKGVEYKYTINI